jgi:hypothetical protein
MASGRIGRWNPRALPLWVWLLSAFGLAVCASMVNLLVFTSDAGLHVVVVNDTAARLRVFECYDQRCTQGVNGDDATLNPGDTSPVLGSSDEGTGRVGEATSPGSRLIGCLSVPHGGNDVPPAHAALASSVEPCPGQRPGSTPVVATVMP